MDVTKNCSELVVHLVHPNGLLWTPEHSQMQAILTPWNVEGTSVMVVSPHFLVRNMDMRKRECNFHAAGSSRQHTTDFYTSRLSRHQATIIAINCYLKGALRRGLKSDPTRATRVD